MGKYGILGSAFDRIFRNTLNKNFEDIDTDIAAQKKRVDDLITGTPQPSEVVDARGGATVLRDRLDGVDAQLAEKATIQQVRLKEIKLGQTDMTEEFLQQMAGTTPINAVPANKSIGKGKIEDTFLDSLKGDIALYSVNKMIPEEITTGKVMQISAGNLTVVDNSAYAYSGFIEVEKGKTYSFYGAFNQGVNIFLYDANKTYLGYLANASLGGAYRNFQYTCNDDATKYVKVNLNGNQPSQLMFVEASSFPSQFIAYKLELYSNKLKTVINGMIPPTTASGGVPTKKWAHFSIDDVYECLYDITANASTYTSIFNNVTFAYLKYLHDTYGATISLYCFTDQSPFSFSTVTTKFQSEFQANKSWLKFGHHAPWTMNYGDATITTDSAKTHYNNFVSGVMNLTGDYECIDRAPRLQNYAGTEASMIGLRDANCGIVGLLGADDTRNSYYLDSTKSSLLYNHERFFENTNQLHFFTTDYRMESVDIINTVIPAIKTAPYANKNTEIEFFTHEVCVKDGYTNGDGTVTTATVKARIEALCQFAKDNGYRWTFPMLEI